MSALPPIADIGTQSRNVRFVPKADIRSIWKLMARSTLDGAIGRDRTTSNCPSRLWMKLDQTNALIVLVRR